MFEQWFYTIPINTAETASIKRECKISPGILRSVSVYFPAGCQYLARCRVSLGMKPVLPRSFAGYIAGEDGEIQANNIFHTIKEDRPVLTWELWNLDDTYTHQLRLSAEWITESDVETQISLLRQISNYLRTFVSKTVAPEIE